MTEQDSRIDRNYLLEGCMSKELVIGSHIRSVSVKNGCNRKVRHTVPGSNPGCHI